MIVGTRYPSDFGENAAHNIAKTLAGAGLVVVSGLALGCDAAAHWGALETGKTVAVLAHGLSVPVYPPENTRLAEQIVEAGGALVCTYQDHVPPERFRFIQRDKVQAGLVGAVIVIETDVNGGTMHAARFAQKHGIPLLVVKHLQRFESDKSKGNDLLLSEGAIPLPDMKSVRRHFGLDQITASE